MYGETFYGRHTAQHRSESRPQGAVLKNDVHYVLVVLKPDPLGQGT